MRDHQSKVSQGLEIRRRGFFHLSLFGARREANEGGHGEGQGQEGGPGLRGGSPRGWLRRWRILRRVRSLNFARFSRVLATRHQEISSVDAMYTPPPPIVPPLLTLSPSTRRIGFGGYSGAQSLTSQAYDDPAGAVEVDDDLARVMARLAMSASISS